jgi:putative ABC transport system permease protein
MGNLWRDVRIGGRVLLRNPGFTAVAVLTLALGIAANTAIFSVVYATFLAPLPYRDADRLVRVWSHSRGQRGITSPADFLEWKQQASAVFDDLQAYNAWPRSFNVATRERPEHVAAGFVTPGYLAMLGYGHPLVLGRDFLDEETTAGKDQVVILTHRLWSERFGADPAIVGRTVRLDGKPFEVVGVLGPTSFDLDQNRAFVPLAFTPEQRDERTALAFAYVYVAGRLKPGVSFEQANARMAEIEHRLAEVHPKTSHVDQARAVRVEPLRNDFLSDRTKHGLWLLLAAVGFVLLIACANVTNLLLARGSARTRELGVRAALGASRRQIVRQLLTESVVLALLGGALGVALAAAMLRVVVALMPPSLLPTEANVQLDLPVLLFSLAAGLLAGMLSGCAPAWQATRTNLVDALKQAGPSLHGGGGWLRQAFVVVEFALALTLLTGGGLALHALATLTRIDLGVHKEHVLTFALHPPEERLAMFGENSRAFYDQLVGRIEALPGVRAASVSTVLPLQRSGFAMWFTVAGGAAFDPAKPNFARINMVSPRYFDTLGIRVLRGRAFDARDTMGAPRVVMVDERIAKKYLAGADPLRHRLMLPVMSTSRNGFEDWQIVGVFADVRHDGPGNEPAEEIAVPFAQTGWPSVSVAVRTAGNPVAVRRSVESAVAALDRDLALADVKTMEQRASESIGSDRFNSLLFGSFAFVALLLAAFGIYGVMAFAVAQRTREIGLRMALGAERGRVLRDVLRQGLVTALAGCAVGSAGAWFAVRALRGIVYGVGGFQPGPLAVVTLTLLGAALLACLVPALRAASVQPMVALRQE